MYYVIFLLSHLRILWFSHSDFKDKYSSYSKSPIVVHSIRCHVLKIMHQIVQTSKPVLAESDDEKSPDGKGKQKKSRTSNWTDLEQEIIIEPCAKKSHILNAAVSSTVTMTLRSKVWDEITAKVNSACGKNRTQAQVKTKWKNLRRKSISNVRAFKKMSTKTGKCTLE